MFLFIIFLKRTTIFSTRSKPRHPLKCTFIFIWPFSKYHYRVLQSYFLILNKLTILSYASDSGGRLESLLNISSISVQRYSELFTVGGCGGPGGREGPVRGGVGSRWRRRQGNDAVASLIDRRRPAPSPAHSHLCIVLHFTTYSCFMMFAFLMYYRTGSSLSLA